MNQHDETRKILELIRENKRKDNNIKDNNISKKLILEQDINVQEEKELDPAEYTEE